MGRGLGKRSAFGCAFGMAETMSRTRGELLRFLFVGVCAVGIDLISYTVLLAVGLPLGVAKGISFAVGTVFAYFANRAITFEGAQGGLRSFVAFGGLYATTLLVNVSLNGAVVALLGRSEPVLGLAFFIATGTSAALNFLGMKFVVFRALQGPKEEVPETATAEIQ